MSHSPVTGVAGGHPGTAFAQLQLLRTMAVSSAFTLMPVGLFLCDFPCARLPQS